MFQCASVLVFVPLVKDKSAVINDSYHWLAAVFAKVNKSIVLHMCGGALATSDLQFGFKRESGCSDAIFTFCSDVNHFIRNGSNVFAAPLDISKAFDRVSHCKLFSR